MLKFKAKINYIEAESRMHKAESEIYLLKTHAESTHPYIAALVTPSLRKAWRGEKTAPLEDFCAVGAIPEYAWRTTYCTYGAKNFIISFFYRHFTPMG
jgi:hypothetical protein